MVRSAVLLRASVDTQARLLQADGAAHCRQTFGFLRRFRTFSQSFSAPRPAVAAQGAGLVRCSITCLSLWERWPSEARTERGGTMLPAVPCCAQAFRCSAPRHRRKNGCKTLSVTFGDSSPKGRAKGWLRSLSHELLFNNTSKPELPVIELFLRKTAPKIRDSLALEYFQSIYPTHQNHPSPACAATAAKSPRYPRRTAQLSCFRVRSTEELSYRSPAAQSCQGQRTTLPMRTHPNPTACNAPQICSEEPRGGIVVEDKFCGNYSHT